MATARYETVGEEKRKELLGSGTPSIQRDPTVSTCTLTAIATARSLVLFLLLGAGGWFSCRLRSYHLEDAFTGNATQLVLDFCGPQAPILTSTGTVNDGFLQLVQDKSRKVLKFQPQGDLAVALGLPELQYFDSEEYFASSPEHTVGLSAGLFRMNELKLNVTVAAGPQAARGKAGRNLRQQQHRRDDGDDQDADDVPASPNVEAVLACLHNLASQHGVDANESLAASYFGKAIIQALTAANRATPAVEVVAGPVMAHGAMLVWPALNNTLWSTSSGLFAEPYLPSYGWKAYRVTFDVLCVLSTGLVVMLYARWFYTEWSKAAVYWVVQYDYLWHDSFVREEQDPNQAPDSATVFRNLPQACSTFFVLDHVVGNVHKNQQEWKAGLLSSALHGAVILTFVPLPLFHGCAFAWWKLPSLSLISLHLFFAAAFGITHYFSVPFGRRCLLLWGHYACCAALIVYSVAYFLSVFVFLITRTIASPDEAIAFSVPMCTLIVYAIVSSHVFVLMRDHYTKVLVEQQAKGNVSAGVASSLLARLDLDLKGITYSVVYGAVLMLLWTALLEVTTAMYTDVNTKGDYITSVMTPLMGIAGTMMQLMGRRDYCQNLMNSIFLDGSVGVFALL